MKIHVHLFYLIVQLYFNNFYLINVQSQNVMFFLIEHKQN